MPTDDTQERKASASDSSTETDASRNDSTASSDKDNSTELSDTLTAVRRDSRNAERRRLVKSLKEIGVDATASNVYDVLKTLKPAQQAAATPEKEGNTSEADKVFTAKLADAERRAAEAEARANKAAVRSTVASAQAGIEFANSEAASDALLAFEALHSFEVEEGEVKVRKNGEPIYGKNGKELSVRDAFHLFIDARPHYKKASAKAGTQTEAKKGTTLTQGLADWMAEEAGVKRS